MAQKLLPSAVEDDEAAVALLVLHKLYDEEMAGKVVEAWRTLATEHDYRGPILWQVPAGFTLKHHAAKAGPCYVDFLYLQDWNFEDTPTSECLVFCVLRLLNGSTSKTADEQLAHLESERTRRELPEHHLTSFGSSAMVAALILAHFKRAGERTPLDHDWVRTDTRDNDEDRLRLGYFVGLGLNCSYDWGGGGGDDLGGFPLGVETLGS